MRRTLTVLVAASSSAVVLALVIPLALLVGRLAQDRALAAATQQAQSVALLIATGTTTDQLRDVIALGDERTGLHTSVVPPKGAAVGPAVEPASLARARGGEAFTTFPGTSAEGAEVFLPVAATSGTTVVRIGVPPASLREGVTRARILLAALGLGLIVASLVAAATLARRVSAPLVRVAEVAHDLRGGALDRRVRPDGPAEVREVGTALNQLAGRIGDLLQAERDAAADLSHRLRTPVTALRLAVDTTADPADRARLREHLERLEGTVDSVVRQARQPVTGAPGSAAGVDLAAVVGERVAFWSALAEDQGRQLAATVEVGGGPGAGADATWIPVAAQDLCDVVDVLLDNVFAHTDAGVALSVLVRSGIDHVELVVEDDGPGLPAADQLGRGHSSAGSTGLGLDIARRVADASGGSLHLGESPTGGARISLSWPHTARRR
jgi:signal transduction histidine kinase